MANVQLHPATALNSFNADYFEIYDSSVNAMRELLVHQMLFMLENFNGHIDFPEGKRYSLIDSQDPVEEISSVTVKDDSIIVTLRILKDSSEQVIDIQDFADKDSNKYVRMFEENIRYTIGLFYLVKANYLANLKNNGE